MERKRRLKAPIWIALLTWTTGLWLPAEARETVLRTPDQLIRGELSFPLADGWSKPVLTRSKDGFALQLWFSEAPLDAISAVARVFSPETRKALTQIEVYQVPGQTVVQIHLRNRAKGLFIKPSNTPRGWTFIANLHEPPEIRGVSYADRKLVKSMVIRTTLGALMKDQRDGLRAPCEMMDEMNFASKGWPAWVALAQADCYRYIGNRQRATEIAEHLVRQRKIPEVVQLLAGLRLEEWPESYNPWVRQGVSNKTMRRLPRSVIQELNLRQARKKMRLGMVQQAMNSFMVAMGQAILPVELEWTTHDVRLELMERSLDAQKPQWAIRVFQAFPAPPHDHPAYMPTLRAAAIGYARMGYMEEATDLAEIVLHPKGSVVDPELTTAVVGSLRKRGADVKELTQAIPSELNWIRMLSEKDFLSPSTSLLLAQWTLDVWNDSGVREAHRMVENPSLIDPSGAYREARMAVMMDASECEALLDQQPGALPPDKAIFATLCLIESGSEIQALDPFGPGMEDPMAEQSLLANVAQRYAESASQFYEELEPISKVLLQANADEMERIGSRADVRLQSRRDGFLDRAELGGVQSLEDLETMGAKFAAAADQLKNSGKIPEGEKVDAALKAHAEASARLLEAIATGKE